MSDSEVTLSDVADRCAAACQTFSAMMQDIERLRLEQEVNALEHTKFADEVTSRVAVRLSQNVANADCECGMAIALSHAIRTTCMQSVHLKHHMIGAEHAVFALFCRSMMCDAHHSLPGMCASFEQTSTIAGA
jgi:hypothetical protein